jgi:L,D-transpeptidase ErfK/SrfK
MRVAATNSESVMGLRLIVVWVVLAGVLVRPVPGRSSEPALIVGGTTRHAVEPGETLTSLAARFGVDATTIASENQLASGEPLEPGRQLLIDNRHIAPADMADGEIVINVPQRMLFYRDGNRVFAYPVAVGRSTWQTPEGRFTVVRKEQDPAWHVPASIRAESARKGQLLPLVVPPGPRNPLGRFWIGLSLAGIGVHGTPVPSSIYQATTHGCLRLQGEGIEDLYGRVTVGAPGRIVYEPVLMAGSGEDSFLEVHRDVYRRLKTATSRQARDLARRLALENQIDWTIADREIERRAGVARRVSLTAE